MINRPANSLTIFSLICGFFSIIFSFEQQFTFACWAIMLSVIFDGLDGQIARRNPTPSAFGKELDSLVDVVSFGIAPSVLGYIFIYREFKPWAAVALFVYLLCSVLRLEKYNVTPKEEMHNYFYGLPTTVSGGTLASFVLIYRKKGLTLLPDYVPALFILMVLVLSCLMLSRIRYPNLDAIKKILGRNQLLIVLAVVLVFSEAAFAKKIGITAFAASLKTSTTAKTINN